VWNGHSIALALHEQVYSEACRYLGPKVRCFLQPQFDDAMGRLVWFVRLSSWFLPMAFFMEPDRSPPPSFRIWSSRFFASWMRRTVRVDAGHVYDSEASSGCLYKIQEGAMQNYRSISFIVTFLYHLG